ncbi:unnamed protein product [[Candida] boidinii]|nr:unnamed protein product [[Candida] boidinii]
MRSVDTAGGGGGGGGSAGNDDSDLVCADCEFVFETVAGLGGDDKVFVADLGSLGVLFAEDGVILIVLTDSILSTTLSNLTDSVSLDLSSSFLVELLNDDAELEFKLEELDALAGDAVFFNPTNPYGLTLLPGPEDAPEYDPEEDPEGPIGLLLFIGIKVLLLLDGFNFNCLSLINFLFSICLSFSSLSIS